MVTDERGIIDTYQARRCAILARRAEGGWALEDTLRDMALRNIERDDALAYAAAARYTCPIRARRIATA